MHTLAAADFIAADADVANAVTLTLFGMELAGTTETYKVLYQGQLATATATVYTVPGATTTFVRSIVAVNTNTASNRAFQLFRGGSAAANAITPLTMIPAGGMAIYEDGRGWQVMNASGQQLTTGYTNILEEKNLAPAGYKAESIERMLCPEVNTTVAASGTLFMQGIYLRAGMVISNIWLHSATTAAATPTNYMAGLYDKSRSLLANSANLLTAAWAANTIKQFALTAQYTVPASDLYYVGYFMTATTVATLKGGTAKTGGQLAGQAPALHGASTTALTTALPNPAAAITGGTASIWTGVS
ncbi:MAG: hypothetical protein ABL903_08430 [Methylococcales bacterium]